MVNYKMKIIIYFVVFFFLLLVNFSFSSERKDEFTVTPIEFNQSGILKLQLKFDLEDQKNFYNWKGSIHPIFNYGLFCDVFPLKDSDKLEAMRVNNVLPVIPHPLDIKSAKKFTYPKLLALRIINRKGRPYLGCIKIRLTYNTEALKDYKNYLSILNITSNTASICNIK